MNIVDISKSLQTVAVKNAPTLLTGMAASGVVTTAFLAAKAGILTGRFMEAHLEYEDHELNKQELFHMVWKLWIPPAIAATGTLVCIFGANTVHTRRNAALAAAYGLSEAAFREYRDKVVEQIGKKAETKVVDAVAQDKIDAHPLKNSEVIFAGSKEMLCYESITGRYFHCDMETIRKAENSINLEIINNMYVSLNEFFDKLGLEAVGMGEDLGWTTGTPLELQFSALLTDSGDGAGLKPVMVLGYRRLPIPEYTNLH